MLPLLLLLTAWIGHFGLHLAAYNRINSTGYQRRTIKRICKLFMASCLVIPIVIAWTASRELNWLHPTLEQLAALHPVVRGYGVICLLTAVLLGIPWVLWRPILHLEAVPAARTVRLHDIARLVCEPLAITTKCKWQAMIPGNQIFQLAVEAVELPVPGLPQALRGLRIAHLSDLHFTGDVSPEYMKQVFMQANQWQPDLCVITGDIIDKQSCIPWLRPVCGSATAKFGKFFILGNHDTRVSDPNVTRQELQQCGWTDLGGRLVTLRIGDQSIELIGNESPWFPAPELAELTAGEDVPFRILLSHSPDQLWWARVRGVKLMLAGHTHGGQGQLPLVGPLLSPSWHGSRFASGDFYKAPTTMHVTRGLGGVHLLRWNCRPELSLITLRPTAT